MQCEFGTGMFCTRGCGSYCIQKNYRLYARRTGSEPDLKVSAKFTWKPVVTCPDDTLRTFFSKRAQTFNSNCDMTSNHELRKQQKEEAAQRPGDIHYSTNKMFSPKMLKYDPEQLQARTRAKSNFWIGRITMLMVLDEGHRPKTSIFATDGQILLAVVNGKLLVGHRDTCGLKSVFLGELAVVDGKREKELQARQCTRY